MRAIVRSVHPRYVERSGSRSACRPRRPLGSRCRCWSGTVLRREDARGLLHGMSRPKRSTSSATEKASQLANGCPIKRTIWNPIFMAGVASMSCHDLSVIRLWRLQPAIRCRQFATASTLRRLRRSGTLRLRHDVRRTNTSGPVCRKQQRRHLRYTSITSAIRFFTFSYCMIFSFNSVWAHRWCGRVSYFSRNSSVWQSFSQEGNKSC